jgi:hypothetical protein
MPPEVVTMLIIPFVPPQVVGLLIVEEAAVGSDCETKNVAEPDTVAGQPFASETETGVNVVVKLSTFEIAVPLI